MMAEALAAVQLLHTLFLATVSWFLFRGLSRESFLFWWTLGWISLAGLLGGVWLLATRPTSWDLAAYALVCLTVVATACQVSCFWIGGLELWNGRAARRRVIAGVFATAFLPASILIVVLGLRETGWNTAMETHVLVRNAALVAVFLFCGLAFHRRYGSHAALSSRITVLGIAIYCLNYLIYMVDASSFVFATHLSPEWAARLDLQHLQGLTGYVVDILAESCIGLGTVLLVVHRSQQAQKQLEVSETHFRGAFGFAPIGMALVGEEGLILKVNRSLSRMLGRKESRLLGRSILDFALPEEREELRETLEGLARGESSAGKEEKRFLHESGTAVQTLLQLSVQRDSQDRFVSIITQFQDISEQRSLEERLRLQAITDALTGLYNRHFFRTIAGQVIELRRRFRIPLSIIFVDLDDFKEVNDRMGHDQGDRLLVGVADLLRESFRSADYIFRWGGDEFLVLISCVGEEAEAKAERLRSGFQKCLSGLKVPSGAGISAGCVEVPFEVRDLAPLIQEADRRMYQEKVSKHENRSIPSGSSSSPAAYSVASAAGTLDP